MHAEVYEYKCSVPRTVVKSYYIYVFTTGPKHMFQHLTWIPRLLKWADRASRVGPFDLYALTNRIESEKELKYAAFSVYILGLFFLEQFKQWNIL